MQREFFICAFQSSFFRLNDASMFQKYSCQVSKPSDVSGGIFFQKSDGRRRSKETFFLASYSGFSSLISRVVTIEYRRSTLLLAIARQSVLRELSFDQQFLDFVLHELRTFLPDHVVAIRLFFQSEGAVVRTNILSPDLSCSRQVHCRLALEKFESSLNIGDRVHELPFPSRQNNDRVLSVHKE